MDVARVRELEGSFVLYADENGERVITTDKLFFDTIHLYDFLNGLERHLLAEDLGQYFGTTYGEWNRFFPSGDYGMKSSRAFFDFLYDYPYEVFRFRDFASGITGESKKFIDSKILYGCEFHVINEFFVIECGVQPFNPIIMRSYGKVDYYHNYEELTEADLNRNKPFAPLLRKVISEKKIKRATRLDIYLIPEAKKSPDDSLLSILIRVGSIGLGGAVVAGTFFILFRSRRKI